MTENKLDAIISALEHLLSHIVYDTRSLRVSAYWEEGQGIVDVYVSGDDLGRVIGRQGRNAKALRTIVRAMAPRSDIRVNFMDLASAQQQ